MKGVFLVFLMLAIAGVCSADVTFYNDKTPALAWDAVTTDVDDDPITGVSYILYLANADTDPNKANPVEVTDTDGDDTNLTATFTLTKGRYFVGVQAALGDLLSVINWGDIIDNQENVPLFGLRWAVSPHPPKKLKK